MAARPVCLHRQSLKTVATIGPWFPLSTIPLGIKHKVFTSDGFTSVDADPFVLIKEYREQSEFLTSTFVFYVSW